MTQHKLDQTEALAHIFFPTKMEKNTAPINATDVDVEVAEGVTIGCRFYGAALDAPNVFFFHGNGEHVAHYDDIAQLYIAHGINLFMTTYRGYGWSDGTPTVTSMYEDANPLFNAAKKFLTANNYTGPIFVMGRSLGSAPAIDLTMRRDLEVKGMIIESGFADTLPLAANLGLDVEGSGLTEEDCFNNRKKIESVTRPTMILHGSSDSMIPAAQAENLQAFSGARGKQFHVIPGAEHNTMIETGGDLYFETIKKWMDTLMGKTDWRRQRRAFKAKDSK